MSNHPGSQEGTMRVWVVEYAEANGAMGQTILMERDEAGNDVAMVFADSAYSQAVQAFNRYRDERLSFHHVSVHGNFGPDAHAHLEAWDQDDGVILRPVNVIGG
jgi:hypothetical protein